jgi:hypothetical protein
MIDAEEVCDYGIHMRANGARLDLKFFDYRNTIRRSGFGNFWLIALG